MRILIIVALVACSGSSRIGAVRFQNAPAVVKVDDRQNVPEPPGKRRYLRTSYYVESFYQLWRRAIRLERPRRALGVNALDEVPDSTWFTNRPALTPDEIRRGPLPESPESYFPWTITKGKSGGTDPGFICEDSRGEKFLLKFDAPKHPEVDTAADAIAIRLMWAVGYNTAADHVVYFRRADLTIAPDATLEDAGGKRPIVAADVDTTLAGASTGPDGRIRGLTSMYIKGKPIGGTPRLGVRRDDPNDLIPHELRRDLRGQAAFFAWLSHVDFKEDNTLDAWQEDPSQKGVHYVVHYLIDFGWALGAAAADSENPALDFRYELDLKETLHALFAFGFRRETWEYRKRPTLRGVGVFGVSDYRPDEWKATFPSMFSLVLADRVDKLWASRILIRLTREQIAAAVDAGRLTDPASARYLVDTLVARQRITALHWFRRTAPLDEFSIEGGKLCFTDVSLRHALETAATTFKIGAHDRNGSQFRTLTIPASANGLACLANAPLSASPERYTVYRIESSRGSPPMLVHVANDAAGTPRIIGLYRL
ncbi:MAG: hypothetical protein H0T46_36915 [Deltaproteobacteria bacterium]|nr:hypothetical protein [Deltaproteobacteria bacterium]